MTTPTSTSVRSRDSGPERWAIWLAAARPKTLPAAVVPVLVGGATAFAVEGFVFLPWLAALVGALLIQVGTNFANDVFDAEQGADTEERLGPDRAVASGQITAGQMRGAMGAVFALAVVVGVYLVLRGGWPVVVIGVASVLSGIFYTATRHSLAYLGLGDLFVLIFFGPVAVMGTHYVQTLQAPYFVAAAAWPVGALATNIIVVNNLRDRLTDLKANKRTLAVRFGRRFSVAEYGILGASAYGAAGLAALWTGSWLLLLPLLTLPRGLVLWGQLRSREGRQLNPLLGRTAQMLLMFGALWALAWAGTRFS